MASCWRAVVARTGESRAGLRGHRFSRAPRRRARAASATTSARPTSPAATAKVARMPAATAAGGAAVISPPPAAWANTAPITAAPVTSPRLRAIVQQAGDDTAPVRADAAHHRGIVGRLEQRVAHRHHHDRAVGGHAQRGRQQCQQRRADYHRRQPGRDRTRGASTTRRPAGRPPSADTSGPADSASPTRAASRPRPRAAGRRTHHQRRHHHRGHQRAGQQPRAQHGLRSMPRRSSGAAARAWTRTKSAPMASAAASSAPLRGPKRPWPVVMASA